MRILVSLSASKAKPAKDQMRLRSKKKFKIEDDEHEYDLSKGEIFILKFVNNSVQILVGDPDYYAFEVSPELLKTILLNSVTEKIQTISLKTAWSIYKFAFFPKLTPCKLVQKDSSKDGVAGYWNQKQRTLALDTKLDDWLGNLLHEMCHQQLEDVQKLKMDNVHDARFQKLAKAVKAKIYNLTDAAKEEQLKSGISRRKLTPTWGLKSDPKYISTFDAGVHIVGAVLAYDQNNAVYIMTENRELLKVAPEGQYEALKEDENIIKLKFKTRSRLDTVLLAAQKKVAAMFSE